jgi:hypothetical protein
MSSSEALPNDAGSLLLSPPPGRGQDSESSSVKQPPVKSEMLPQTRSAIERFASRRAGLQICRGVAIGIVTLIVGMIGLMILDHFISLATPLRILATCAVYGATIAMAWKCGLQQSRQRDWSAIARSMESATPPLRERLLSAVELEDPRHANGSRDFRSSLQSGVAGDLSAVDIRSMLPWKLVARSLIAAFVIITAVVLLSLVPALQMPRRLARVFAPIVPIERASITQIEITAPSPASRSVAEGDLVAVIVSVEKLRGDEVLLQWQSDDGREGDLTMSPRALTPSLNDDETTTTASGSRNESRARRESFAVNLQVDTQAVHYRILAGDAETRWHTLSPMPRPRVVEFAKRYSFPSYAKLPDAVAIEDFGDLEALVGTRAEVTVTFDQPVSDAQVYFGDSLHEAGVPMQQVDDDPTKMRFHVAIKTPGSYRIDAVSLDSDLNNPFLPRCVIDPVFDRSPTAAWPVNMPERQIVSSASVLKLQGQLEDDLPMDRYITEYILDGAAIRERVVPLITPLAQLPLDLQWDLMDLTGSGTNSEPLPPGSLLQVRLVAIDRAGHRGESPWKYLYIGGDAFDADRHQPLLTLQKQVARLNAWFNDCGDLLEQLKTASQQAKDKSDADDFAPSESFTKELVSLKERWQELAGTMDAEALRKAALQNAGQDQPSGVSQPRKLDEMMFLSNDSVATDHWSLLDRFATATISELPHAIERWQLAADLSEDLSQRQRQRAANEVFSVVQQLEQLTKQTRELPSAVLAIELAAGLLNDMNAIRDATELLASKDSSVPIERLPGQAALISQQLQQIQELVNTLQPDLHDETTRHLNNFVRFTNESVTRIDRAVERLQTEPNPDVERDFRDSMAGLRPDMEYHHANSFVHGNTFNRVLGTVRDLSRDNQQNRAAIESLARAGRDLRSATEQLTRAREQQDTAKISDAVAEEKLHQLNFSQLRNELLTQYDRSEAREQVRADMQISTASDLKLVRRVVEEISQAGFVKIGEQSPDDVFNIIDKAAKVLESGGQVQRFAKQLQDVADRERFGKNIADRALRQGMRVEHYSVIAETPIQQLRAAEFNNQIMDNLQASRWDEDFSQARDTTTRRRWDNAPPRSAAVPVQSLVTRLNTATPIIEQAMDEARATLRAFLPTTSELAKAAAKEAKKQAEQSNPESNPETKSEPEAEKPSGDDAEEKDADANADEADAQQDAPSESPQQSEPQTAEQQLDALQEKVDRLAEDLVDRANAADLSNADERELARDADAALEKIQKQMEAVAAPIREAAKQASPEAQTSADPEASERLNELAETLETTAEHFEAADSGEDVSETREALRESDASEMSPDAPVAPPQSAQSDPVSAARENAAATSELAQASPQELLKRLENQLKKDPPMQEKLADISSQTVANAEQTVREAAKQEERLQRELEKADPNLQEQKRALRDQLRSLNDQARAITDQWLATAENASNRAENKQAQESLSEMRQELREASGQADQVQSDEALLSEIQAASQQLQQKLQQASEKSQELKSEAEKASQEDAHQDDRSRRERADQLESEQRRVQNEWVKQLANQVPQWRQRREEAGRRVQEAEKQKREAENQLKEAEKQLEKNPNEDWAKHNVQERRRNIDDAQRAAEAAQKTRDAAEKAEQQAAQQTEAEKKQSVDKLEAKNPTAELLARAAQKSSDEMQRLAEGLQELAEQAQAAEAPAPPRAAAESLARQQNQTREAVQQAADDLQRAARHEDRLGNADAAEQLTDAAKQLENTLQSPMQPAQESLQKAGDKSTESPPPPAAETSDQLGKAAEQLAQQAESLSGLAESLKAAEAQAASNAAQNTPPSSGTLAETSRSEKLARTLDELDRALNSSPPMAAESAAAESAAGEAQQAASGQTPSGQAESGQSESGQAQSGQPGEQSGQPQQAGGQPSPTAGQASPTLAAAAEQAARNLAAARQQQLSQIAAAGQPQQGTGDPSQSPPGEPGSQPSNQPGTPGSQSGDSLQMPEGGSLAIDDTLRADGDWGNLREEKNEDMIQDRKTRVPLSYRPAIEAYFQAIAAEAAKTRSDANGGNQ